ncbi:MAG: LCP family protein [Actinomycetota bacterium]
MPDDSTRRLSPGGSSRNSASVPPGYSSNRAPDAPPGAGVQYPNQQPGTPRPQSAESLGANPGRIRQSERINKTAGPAPARAPRPRRFRLRWLMALIILALLAHPIALGLVAWRSLGRVDALPADTATTPGRTYLVVGSDSRRGLSTEDRNRLNTGTTEGQRTDTIMLLHVPVGGGPTVLMSIPRDSYVEIPGKGSNKINAAYAFGGPKLLAQTIEQTTGVQIDDYVEIGFGGFATMVDAVGGVQICPSFAMNDPRAGINLKKGCQEADGATALGYARARYSDPRGDFGRVERQREVLAAIVQKATTPSTVLNPFRSFPLASSGGSSLTVDENTGPLALTRFVFGMRGVSGGDGISMTVPVAGTGSRTGAGSVVLWDDSKAKEVFNALKRSDTEPTRRIAEEQKLLAR